MMPFCKGTLATSSERQNVILMLTVIKTVSVCFTTGAVFKPYHNSTRWLLLPFHFTDGKTEAQKIV